MDTMTAESRQPRLVAEGPFFAMLWESVLFDHRLRPASIVLYAVIQRHFGREGQHATLPTEAELATMANLSRDTVIRCLDQLATCGHIEKRRTRYGLDVVLITPKPDVADSDFSDVAKTDISNPDVAKTDLGSSKTRLSRARDKEVLNSKEKERDDDSVSPPEKPLRRRPRTPIDPAFYPDEHHLQAAAEKGWGADRVAREVQRFINYHEREGTLAASWMACWRTWVDKGIGFDARDSAQRNPRNEGGLGVLAL